MILRTYFVLVVFSLILASCANKMICPAYQSTFIHDKETLRKKFSYFENDSLPKVYTASKTKYLIAVPESYRKRYRKMQTVEMKPIYPIKEDSTLAEDSIVTKSPLDSLLRLDSAAISGLDSLTRAKLDSARLNSEDSIYVISTAKEKFNIEQENYMWFFRKELILPDVRLSKIKETAKEAPASGTKEKKGFLRKLMFWKKDKNKAKADSLNISPTNLNSTDSLDFFTLDSASNTKPATPQIEQPKKKGGLFRKKDKKESPADPAKQPAKKEEDGF